jgi:hypothetical protein
MSARIWALPLAFLLMITGYSTAGAEAPRVALHETRFETDIEYARV